MESKPKRVAAECPDCGETVTLRGPVRVGQRVTCPHCESVLEVVESDPVELDWAYDEDLDQDEDEEDDEDW